MKYNSRVRIFDTFRDVRKEMKNIGVDETGIQIMVPKCMHVTVKCEKIKTSLANIIKQEFISVGGDAATSRNTVNCKDPYTDILLMGTIKQYNMVCAKLYEQPVELQDFIKDINKAIRYFSKRKKTKILRCRDRKIKLNRTMVMGILNVSPDSFSGDGITNKKDAVAYAMKMVDDGVDIIDIGGQSTRPFSKEISIEKELNRVIPVIEELVDKIDVPISVDTYKPEVAKKSLDAGACIVNDVTGLRTDRMIDLISDYHAGIVIMHMRGMPKNMQINPKYRDVVGDIYSYLNDRMETAMSRGISRTQIIIDPGLGFGKTLNHNIIITKKLGEFSSLGVPILVGPSRKSFIGKILDLPTEQRLEGTLGWIAVSIMNGADIVRVHDVMQAKRVCKIVDAIMR